MDARARADTLRYRALLQLLRTADAIWMASRGFFNQWEITASQFNVLNLLATEPAGLSQIELSRQLITHRSNVTGLVDRMEKRGLVRRQDVAADRRAYRVVLTQKGRALLEEIWPDYHRAGEGVWQGISSPRLSEIILDLEKATRNAESLSSKYQREPTELPPLPAGEERKP